MDAALTKHETDSRILTAKFAGKCCTCGVEWAAGDRIRWHFALKAGTCVGCKVTLETANAERTRVNTTGNGCAAPLAGMAAARLTMLRKQASRDLLFAQRGGDAQRRIAAAGGETMEEMIASLEARIAEIDAEKARRANEAKAARKRHVVA